MDHLLEEALNHLDTGRKESAMRCLIEALALQNNLSIQFFQSLPYGERYNVRESLTK